MRSLVVCLVQLSAGGVFCLLAYTAFTQRMALRASLRGIEYLQSSGITSSGPWSPGRRLPTAVSMRGAAKSTSAYLRPELPTTNSCQNALYAAHVSSDIRPLSGQLFLTVILSPEDCPSCMRDIGSWVASPRSDVHVVAIANGYDESNARELLAQIGARVSAWADPDRYIQSACSLQEGPLKIVQNQKGAVIYAAPSYRDVAPQDADRRALIEFLKFYTKTTQ